MTRAIILAALVVGAGCGGMPDPLVVSYADLRAAGLSFRTGDLEPDVMRKTASLGPAEAIDDGVMLRWLSQDGCELYARFTLLDPNGAAAIWDSECICTSPHLWWAETYRDGQITDYREHAIP